MDRDYSPQSWLDASQALELLRTSTGLQIGCRELLKLCRAELCRAYIDCSFAVGVVCADQLLVSRIRGDGYGELLDAAEAHTRLVEFAGIPMVTVGGSVIVRGSAWVYASEQPRPVRDEGIWRFALGGVPRLVHFRPEEIAALAGRIRTGEQPLQIRRASA